MKKELLDNHYELNMSDFCRMVYDDWSSVNNAILKNEWDMPLKLESEQSSEDFEIIKKDIDEELATLNRLPVCGGCDRVAVINWFQIDKKHNTNIQVDTNDILQDFINETLGKERANLPTTTLKIYFTEALKKRLRWFELQNESNSEKLLILRHIH